MSGFTDPNALSERVKAIPGGDMLMMCYSCGTCTSKCMIQTKLESSYNPRRLIREAVFNMDEAAFADKTTWLCTACDLCYPACPQKIHISGVINAVKALAVESGEKVCPYDAIRMVEKRVAFRGNISVASVDQGKCMACGMCTAACRSTSIRLTQDYNDAELLDSLWSWLGAERANS